MKKFILGIGMPGSGKTTTLKVFAEKNSYTYICPDDIREEMTGNMMDQSRNKDVWDMARNRLKEAIERGETVVFDATSHDPEKRKELIAYARNCGAEKTEGVFVDTPFKVAKERNLHRGKEVPNPVLRRMDDDLYHFPPSVDDGFDALFTLDKNQELEKVTIEREDHTLEKEFEKKMH